MSSRTNAMHTDSALTLRFHIGDRLRGAADGERSVSEPMRKRFPSSVCLGLLLGCSSAHYTTGHGDAGQFMLQHAVGYGGRPVNTNGLPTLGGEWSYIEDAHGVGLLFPLSRYSEVQAFLTSAFGPPPHKGGWGVRDIGAAIYLQTNNVSTLVGVNPPYLRVQQ
jgi:hypothetical protein